MDFAEICSEYRLALRHEAEAETDEEGDQRHLMTRHSERRLQSASPKSIEDVALALEIVREIAVDGDVSGSDPLVRHLVEASITALRALP